MITATRRANANSRAFNPLDVGGLALWLEAGRGTYQDVAGTTPATADADVLQLWQDQSGQGRHFSEDTAGDIPILKTGVNGINGLPVARFSGSELLVCANAFLTGQTGLVLAVARPARTAGTSDILFASADQASTTRYLAFWINAGGYCLLQQKNADTSDGVRPVQDLLENSPYLFGLSSNGTATSIAINGHTQTLVINVGANNGDWFGDVTGLDNVTLGAWKRTTEGDHMSGDLAEILIYEPRPTDAEIVQLTWYLADKYGLAIYERTTLDNMTAVGMYDSDNPAIPQGAPGSSDVAIREPGNILYEPTDTGQEYKTWYTGRLAGSSTIHYAYSTDGKSWTKYAANPVIDARTGEDPYVVKSGATYYLYCEDVGLGAPWNVRRWSSNDLTTWNDDGVLTGLAGIQPQSPTVWIEDTVWYMLYEDGTSAPYPIRLATSSDGLDWTDVGDPVFTIYDVAFEGIDSTDVVPDDILKIGATYYMLYHAHISTISINAIAFSTNLTTWVDGTRNPINYVGYASGAGSIQFCNDGNLSTLGIAGGSLGPLIRGYPARRTR